MLLRMSDRRKFRLGQRVWSERIGWAVITDVDFQREFPLWVSSEDDTMAEMYREDGTSFDGGPRELWTEEEKDVYGEQLERLFAR